PFLFSPGKEEGLTSEMLSVCTRKMVLLAPLLLMTGLISTKAATPEEESGTAIPAESKYYISSLLSNQHIHIHVTCGRFWGRPCVDCHAFEFMQRALQDLKKTAYNLDSRV
ncbi:hypothetical protein E2320_004955, partial [Naja naja]